MRLSCLDSRGDGLTRQRRILTHMNVHKMVMHAGTGNGWPVYHIQKCTVHMFCTNLDYVKCAGCLSKAALKSHDSVTSVLFLCLP